ncbi:MAG: RNHCP domain-containing protein [Lachnospiraceae bacterium]|jgi:hypothetical protein|nr:RNHCP domain-containing protein [Lachnospiraceae bacterium]
MKEQNFTSIDHGSDNFSCQNCSHQVETTGAGSSHRNHCPNCLFSLHVDDEQGDRAADCGGVMEPISIWVKKNGEWALIHRCKICGELNHNRIAADDNPLKLLSLSVKPLANPPFPIERIKDLL